MPAPHNSADSPVMRQYLEVKSRYSDAIIMFRMGDFYELFFEDAVTVAPVLDIAVTSRDKNAEDPVPMAGVPYHAIGGYLRTLVERGYKVAICEQLESPDEAKKRKGPDKIVRRDVVRVVTPGALLDDEHLQSGEANYFCVVVASREGKDEGYCVVALDISQGEVVLSENLDASAARAELARLAPREVLADESMHEWLRECVLDDRTAYEELPADPSKSVFDRVDHLWQESRSARKLGKAARRAAALTLAYAEHTQPGQTLLVHRIREHVPASHLVLDETSLRNLEIFRTARDGAKKGSLLWAVDNTRTAMGARLLREWLSAPLRDIAAITLRHEAVARLLDSASICEQLQSHLKDMRDIVRLAARARLKAISPRELGALRDSLVALPRIAASLAKIPGAKDVHLLELGADLLPKLAQTLSHFLVDQPPSISREGGFVRKGADPEFDAACELRDGGRSALAAIEVREREATGISNLKVQHNRVFGYFLEISKSQLAKVPKGYVRKQTTANAERYVTDELAQLESKVLGAQSEALIRELAIFEDLREQVSAHAERLCELGDRVAMIDVLCGFSELAREHQYVRPTMHEEPMLDIREGRHPVIERLLVNGEFVPNHTRLHADCLEDSRRMWLITGPNMGGKSTIMRQVALIAILAHAGSFVPATRAEIGLIDRVFTRVGAADDLGRGDSTFMVEMRETAQILAQASRRSLVLLDEIGRGTATFDGLALAWAIVEFLHDQVGCRTLFATHYHELCGLPQRLAGIENVHVRVHEQRGKILFLHRIEAGAAGRSYGIQVGQLAGLPARVLRRAGRILTRLEGQDLQKDDRQLDLFSPRAALAAELEHDCAEESGDEGSTTATGVDSRMKHVVEELEALDLDATTPRDAFALLERWHRQLTQQPPRS